MRRRLTVVLLGCCACSGAAAGLGDFGTQEETSPQLLSEASPTIPQPEESVVPAETGVPVAIEAAAPTIPVEASQLVEDAPGIADAGQDVRSGPLRCSACPEGLGCSVVTHLCCYVIRDGGVDTRNLVCDVAGLQCVNGNATSGFTNGVCQ
jgi:hypothetical protein